MTSRERKICNSIIHSASVTAAGVGAGLAQLPCSDSAIITPIQVTMTISLGRVFGLDIDTGYAKALIATAAATWVGRGVSQLLVGWIPGPGNVINAVTAAGITEAIGWAIANDFANVNKTHSIQEVAYEN